MRSHCVVGDSDITHFPLLLERAYVGKLGLQIEEVMHLHQVQVAHLEQAHRILDLLQPGVLAAGPHLGRDEHARTQVLGRDQVTGHRLGAAVHGRGVEQSAATAREDVQNLDERRALGAAAADVEHAGRAQTDDRQLLSGGGNLALEHGGLSRAEDPRRDRSQRRCRRRRLKKFSPREHGSLSHLRE